MIVLDYKEFLKLPYIERNFNSMFTKQKEYFRTKCSAGGFDKEYTELMSIKMAIISTDLYFTDIHKNKSEQ